MIYKHVFVLILTLSSFFRMEASVVDTLTIPTKYLASPENVVVISPDISLTERCPSIYLLNGYSDNHLAWTTIKPDLPELSDKLGVFFIMPDGRDSWYWDSPVDSDMRMESFIVNDLVPFIDSTYNTIDSSDKRAISGLSMGGHGAMWLAIRHPQIWQNVGSTSGGLDIRPFPERWKLKQRLGDKENNPAVWDAHTVINLIPKITPDQLNIIFDCGTNDFFYSVNTSMHKALLDAGIPHDFISRPGGHSRDYWANSILYHLLYFKENFDK